MRAAASTEIRTRRMVKCRMRHLRYLTPTFPIDARLIGRILHQPSRLNRWTDRAASQRRRIFTAMVCICWRWPRRKPPLCSPTHPSTSPQSSRSNGGDSRGLRLLVVPTRTSKRWGRRASRTYRIRRQRGGHVRPGLRPVVRGRADEGLRTEVMLTARRPNVSYRPRSTNDRSARYKETAL